MERMEAIGNGGLGGDKRSRDWAKLEGFLRQSQRINEMKLMKSMGWRKQAHKCWLYCFSSSLLMCFSNYTPPPSPRFSSNQLLLLLSTSFSCLPNLSPSSPAHIPPPPPSPLSSHLSSLSSSLCPSTPAVSLILVPSPPACPYSQLVQYSSLWATVRQIVREGGLHWHWRQHFTGSSAGSTLLQYACA